VVVPSFLDNAASITDFGAVGDGVTLNTSALPEAIKAVAEKCLLSAAPQSDGSDPLVNVVRSDSSKLTVRGDEKAYKSWIEPNS
jgi:polygalacturonase